MQDFFLWPLGAPSQWEGSLAGAGGKQAVPCGGPVLRQVGEGQLVGMRGGRGALPSSYMLRALCRAALCRAALCRAALCCAAWPYMGTGLRGRGLPRESRFPPGHSATGPRKRNLISPRSLAAGPDRIVPQVLWRQRRGHLPSLPPNRAPRLHHQRRGGGVPCLGAAARAGAGRRGGGAHVALRRGGQLPR